MFFDPPFFAGCWLDGFVFLTLVVLHFDFELWKLQNKNGTSRHVEMFVAVLVPTPKKHVGGLIIFPSVCARNYLKTNRFFGKDVPKHQAAGSGPISSVKMARRLLPVFMRRRSSIIHSSYDISWRQRRYRFWDANREAFEGLLPLTEATFNFFCRTSCHDIIIWRPKINEIQCHNLNFRSCQMPGGKIKQRLYKQTLVMVWSSLLYLFWFAQTASRSWPKSKK